MSNITNIFTAIMITTIISGYSFAHPIEDQASVPIPTPALEVATPIPTPIPTDIVGYIEYKFGDDAWKAFKILQGEECHENRHLDPNAKNDNTIWGGLGVDRGYWQINSHFHPHISDWCASDVVCSTDYAYRMYKNDDSFERWTCGRYYGI
jgi:hypothetical protein